jgi:NAD(P)H dehydrogenase (quinone)
VHLRINLFSEWLLYTSPLIRAGRYLTPFEPARRFVSIAADDIVRVVFNII